MKRHETNGLATYQFEALDSDHVRHAVFTRRGGVSTGHLASLNVGRAVGDDPHRLAENHARIYAHLGVAAAQVATGQQVHGNRVARVSSEDGGDTQPTADALITNTPALALMLRFADCQPILLYDPEHHALALVHAGWRGAALGIPRRAVEAMQAAFGTRPAAIWAGLGPCIGPCCYQVGDDVASALGYALPDWREAIVRTDRGWWLDLSAANAQLLQQAGVSTAERSRLCTACRLDEFYSHRAEGGRTGRFAVLAMLAARQGTARATSAPPAEPPSGEPGPDDWAEPTSLQAPGLPDFGETTS
jgi:YfiH family protein